MVTTSGRKPKPQPKKELGPSRDAMQRLDAADGKMDGKYFGRKINSPVPPSSSRVRSRSAPNQQNKLVRPPSRNAEAWEEEYRLLKQQLMDLDRQEQELGRRHDERDRRFHDDLDSIDDRLYTELELAHDREKKEFSILRQRSLSGGHKDVQQFQNLATEKTTAESRFWQLREHDLQEQFTYRERELHRMYEAEILRLQDELAFASTSGRIHHAVERDHLRPQGGARLGVEIAEWRQAMTTSGEVLKTHPGVKIVSAEGPAAKSGLQSGDIITKLSISTNIGNRIDFKHAMDKVQPGETVVASVERDGMTQNVAITSDGVVPLVGY